MRHFYHVYAAGNWVQAVAEHAQALADAKFTAPVTIGLVGSPPERQLARQAITGLFPFEPDTWIEAGVGFEQVTLAALHEYAAGCEDMILYAHTKGAWNSTWFSPYWRRSMTRHVIGRWRECVQHLEENDTVGCHWLTPERHNQPPLFVVTSPFYGGNFWWARADYLRRLPQPLDGSRYNAEGWIGLGDPRAADLLPGWPTPLLCMTPEEREGWRKRVSKVRGPASSCLHADPSCAGPMRWTSVSGGHLDNLVGDSVPLCHSHSLRYDMELGL